MTDPEENNSKSSDIDQKATKSDGTSNGSGLVAATGIDSTTGSHKNPTAPPAPNSKPREKEPAPVETYMYRDFANAEPSTLDTGMCHGEGRMPPQSLQSQKLPSKLSSMLSDPDLSSILTWMPHGRSWKILNRELFSSFALPRYFGHSNHASFVRVVNAWGFRRISIGVDRDSYYHELFLRGKPSLHQRMKRLPSCHRKTHVDKDDRCPDFYELAKTSPLPEVTWSSNSNQSIGFPGVPTIGGGGGGGAFPPHLNGMMGNTPYLPEAVKPIHYGDATGAFSSNGLIGSGIGGVGGMGVNSCSTFASDNPMLSLLGMNDQRTGNGTLAPMPPSDASSLAAYTQNLQRENEKLMLKIKLLEYENQAKQLGQQQSMAGNSMQRPNNNFTAGGVAGIGTNMNINMGGMSGANNNFDTNSNNNPSNDGLPNNSSAM
ncbi:hypothetical protein ACHAXR_007845 [Thalassiosira sp. AJA248-18]